MGRGLYHAIEPMPGQAGRARLRQIGFDDVTQSPDMITRMRAFELIAGARQLASREEVKEYYAQIMNLGTRTIRCFSSRPAEVLTGAK